MTKRAYFGTDGIRGQANSHPMTAEVALRVIHSATLKNKTLPPGARLVPC